MAARSDVALPEYPSATTASRSIKGASPKSPCLPIGPSVGQAIGDLPDADGFDELLGRDWVETTLGEPSPYSAILRGLASADDDYSRPRESDTSILTSSARTIHTESSKDRFASTTPGHTEPVSRFLRLHPEGISNTLRAGTAADRGAHTSPRPIHPEHARVITVREGARLHGYPDWFRFHTTKWHGFREIGNSVPPLLARAVAGALLRADRVAPQAGEPVQLGAPDRLSLTASEAERHFGIVGRAIPQRHHPKAHPDQNQEAA